MLDSHQRAIEYARVSITDRCNLRCIYCMPPEGVVKQRHEDILSYEDIVRVCRAFSAAGIDKIRITGGEPLVRRGAARLVAALKALTGIAAVTMTTNGQLLADQAADLRAAGLDGVNISLDTLDPVRYRNLTRGGAVEQTLRGIDAALAHGFPTVKINCVPMAEADIAEYLRVAELARSRPLHVRFIEMMPLGAGAGYPPLDREELRKALRNAFGAPKPVAGPSGGGPARYFSLPGFLGAIGFIDTLGHDICGRCNRLRLTADGLLKSCLHSDSGVTLKPALAAGGDALMEAVAAAIRRKPPRHEFSTPGTPRGERRPMSRIGG